MQDVYEITAIKYGSMAKRTRRENFMQLDPHEAAPMPIDYFVWVIRNEARTIVVDTGFDHEEATRRGRKIDRLPREGLAMLGIDAATVEDVVVTHLHYDHAGTQAHFAKARFHLQEAELAYTTGRCMCYEALRAPYSAEHVCDMIRNVFAGRVAFQAGDKEIHPGISVHLIGGHAKGIQCVRVKTRRGFVVLASDSTHYYENFLRYRPFIITHDVEATLKGYDRLRELASSEDHVVPGHDPLVLQRYPAAGPGLEGIAVRLDLAPAPLGA